jgi:hypothetical protein
VIRDPRGVGVEDVLPVEELPSGPPAAKEPGASDTGGRVDSTGGRVDREEAVMEPVEIEAKTLTETELLDGLFGRVVDARVSTGAAHRK